MQIIRERITRQDLFDHYATKHFVMTKAVVDVVRGIMAVDAEWHADLETMLLEDGSVREDLWGVNLNLTKPAGEFIEFDSLINIRPAQRSFTTRIDNEETRARIRLVVDALVDYHNGLTIQEPLAPYGLGPYQRPVAVYPCFLWHREVTMEKWRSFEPWKRVVMIANEFGRAQSLLSSDSIELWMCYERALEIVQITLDAARIEGRPKELTYGLLHLRERTARLYAGRILDPEENARLKEECFRLEPEAWRLTHPETDSETLKR
jgi:hypothetical protein